MKPGRYASRRRLSIGMHRLGMGANVGLFASMLLRMIHGIGDQREAPEFLCQLSLAVRPLRNWLVALITGAPRNSGVCPCNYRLVL